MTSTATSTIQELADREYKYGFFTDVETDTVPIGLNEDVIRLIWPRRKSHSFCSNGGSRPTVTG